MIYIPENQHFGPKNQGLGVNDFPFQFLVIFRFVC